MSSYPIPAVAIIAALLLLMQAGFALVNSGLCRARNAGHVVLANLMIMSISILAFWIFGAHWMNVGKAGDGRPLVIVSLLVSIASVIPAGAMAERWSFRNILLYAIWAGALPVAIYGRWIWGGGWLSQLDLGHGVIDFAGSGVIHMSAGVIALVGSLLLGPRVGKYARDGRPKPMPGHNLVFVVVGTMLLFAAWFGFNCSSGAGLEQGEVIAVNTLLAGMAGGVCACVATLFKFRKPDPSMICNGVLAGLVSICAACPFVNFTAAITIGAIAGFLVVHAVLFLEGRLKIDDPVGAISVHGICGAWGLVAAGIFSSGAVCGALGKVFGGLENNWAQLAAQLTGLGVGVAFIGAMAFVWFKISNRLAPMRSRRDFEMIGLDLPETGAECYPDFHLTDKGAGHGQ